MFREDVLSELTCTRSSVENSLGIVYTSCCDTSDAFPRSSRPNPPQSTLPLPYQFLYVCHTAPRTVSDESTAWIQAAYQQCRTAPRIPQLYPRQPAPSRWSEALEHTTKAPESQYKPFRQWIERDVGSRPLGVMVRAAESCAGRMEAATSYQGGRRRSSDGGL